MSNTPNLKLPFLDANQNQKTVTHNAALTVLDALVNCRVQSATLTAPPASPGDGQCWIIGSGATGAWAGRDLNVAAWQDGAWTIYPPTIGMLAYNAATDGLLVWSGSAWVTVGGNPAPVNQFADIGIGTAADPGNPLTATLNNALFNALGTGSAGSGDVRIKLNKQATGNTASFLFQDGYSGRAEIGLTGDDDFHFKVSPDGSSFYDGIVVTAAGGAVKTPFGLSTPSLNGGPLAGFRNRVINGNFAVNQRGYVSGTALAAGAYGHDRWKAGAANTSYVYAQGVVDTQITIISGQMDQIIDSTTIEGGAYTYSWYGTVQGQIFVQAPGESTYTLATQGASPLTLVEIQPGSSIVLRTVSSGTYGLVQFEPGLVATLFERRPLGLELSFCHRYYYNWIPCVTYAFALNGTDGFRSYVFKFPVRMRIIPACTTTGRAGSSALAGTPFIEDVTLDQAACRYDVVNNTGYSAPSSFSANAEL